MAGLLLAAVAVAALLAGEEPAAGRGAPPVGDGTGGIEAVEVNAVPALVAPVSAAFAPGETGHAYVVEQRGTVQRVPLSGGPATEFLDIRDRVADGSSEQGLLGLAFDPDFAGTGLVYAYYTQEGTGDIVVSEFDASALDANESTHRVVIRIRHRFASNHNGGTLLFGPDGFLYLGTGDGGGAGDPRENAQDRGSLLGKLLRIDPQGAANGDHSSPPGNPYVGRRGRDEIYAVGLRNPYRFTFDSVTGRIAIGDVGQDRTEEVDYETPTGLRNANFGWDRFEGRRRYRDSGGDVADTPKRRHHDRPIHTYGHSRGCAITGGLVVRDEDLDSLYGRYLYADYCEGELRSVVPRLARAEADRLLGVSVGEFGPSAFTENPATGDVYATSLAGTGALLRLDPAP